MSDTRWTALITGASAGLGLEMARLLAKDGHGLVLVARRRDKLEEIAAELRKAHDVKVLVVAADLGDPAAPAEVLRQVEAAGIEVGLLVNNAGYGSNGAFAELDPAKEVGMVDLNVRALVHLTRLFLPGMIARKRGRVLNVGSTAGFVPGPFMATYYATKAFVLSFTEALAFELEGTGVTVTVLCPGATATEFAAVSGTSKMKLFQSGVADAVSVARFGLDAARAGKVIAVPGLMNKLTALAPRISPRSLARAIASRYNRP